MTISRGFEYVLVTLAAPGGNECCNPSKIVFSIGGLGRISVSETVLSDTYDFVDRSDPGKKQGQVWLQRLVTLGMPKEDVSMMMREMSLIDHFGGLDI